MSRYEIAVLPGDGIGPEVMDAAIPVLAAAAASAGDLRLDFQPHAAGAGHFRRAGVALPQQVLDACKRADAVLLAAIGLPEVRRADGTEVQPEMMMGLRRELGLYAAVRPIRLYPGVQSTLRDTAGGVDFVVIRENSEGLFASFGGGIRLEDEMASDTLVVTRRATERIAHFAFRLAAKRQGRPRDGKRLVTCVDKANVFRSYAFFRQVFSEVAAGYPQIGHDAVYVDAASLYFLQQPDAFDVIVTENQFGDILSDLGAGLVGGLGMAPSAEIGDRYALFQPSHGSAPTLAGQDLANPLATILSGAMMLEWLGERKGDPLAASAARQVEAAVGRVLREGRTLPRDLGGRSGTQAVGEAVRKMLDRVR